MVKVVFISLFDLFAGNPWERRNKTWYKLKDFTHYGPCTGKPNACFTLEHFPKEIFYRLKKLTYTK